MNFKAHKHHAKKSFIAILIECNECSESFWWINSMTPEFCPNCGIPYGEKKPIDYPKTIPKPVPIPHETIERIKDKPFVYLRSLISASITPEMIQKQINVERFIDSIEKQLRYTAAWRNLNPKK